MSNTNFDTSSSDPSSSQSHQRDDSRTENQYTANASRTALTLSTSTQQPPSTPPLPSFDKKRWLFALEPNHILTWHRTTPAARRAGADFYEKLIFRQPFPPPCPHQRIIAVIHPFFARYADEGWSTVVRIKIPKTRSDGSQWEMEVLGSREWRKMGKQFLLQPPTKKVKVLGSGFGNPNDKLTSVYCAERVRLGAVFEKVQPGEKIEIDSCVWKNAKVLEDAEMMPGPSGPPDNTVSDQMEQERRLQTFLRGDRKDAMEVLMEQTWRRNA